MTSRERFLAALKNEQPDRVPAAPDISNMVPCRLTGKPFWDIYLRGDPPLWRAHPAANRRFGFDAWFYRGSLNLETDHTNKVSHRVVEKTDERIIRETTTTNRLGSLTTETIYFIADSPWLVTKPIKDPVRQERGRVARSSEPPGIGRVMSWVETSLKGAAHREDVVRRGA